MLAALDDGDRDTAQTVASDLRDALRAQPKGTPLVTVKPAVLMAIIDHAVDPDLCTATDEEG